MSDGTLKPSGLVDVEEVRRKLESRKPESYRWNYENGRRYASADLGGYFLPNDDPEIERLNEQHWIFTQAKGGKIFNAPIDPEQPGFRILDIGCGSGIWCMQMADAFPNCSIVGMDISPIQPVKKPSNVEWVLHNVETEWPFSNDHFDFVRLSVLNGSLADLGSTMQTIMRHLRPGGFVEHQEYSLGPLYQLDNEGNSISELPEIDKLPPLQRWARLMELGGERRGRSLKLAPNLKNQQTAAGLEAVTEKVYPLPIGTWPEDEKDNLIGSHMMLQGIQNMDGLTTMMFTKALAWSLEDTQKFVQKVKEDIRNDDLHKFLDLHLVYGQKFTREQDTSALENLHGLVNKYNAGNWLA